MPTTIANVLNANDNPLLPVPLDVVSQLSSSDPIVCLKALRNVKNQIIGNRTKKLSFIKLGVIPELSSILAGALTSNEASNVLIQSAAALGSFACGFDPGVQAVLDSDSFPLLLQLLSHPDEKVVDAGSRALRIIYQSKFAPKFDFLDEKNVKFLASLLDSNSTCVSSLGASIITHSCQTRGDQNALCNAGVISRLQNLLKGSPSQRESSLEALGAMFQKNEGVVEGRLLSSIIEMTKDRCLKTRLLACRCLIVVMESSTCFLQDKGIRNKLVCLLLQLLEDPNQVADEAPFVLSRLIDEKEDMQHIAFESNAVDILCLHLSKWHLRHRRIEGLLLAVGDLCSRLESCRSKFLLLQGLDIVTDFLNHESDAIRVAACGCLKRVSRSIKNLCAGSFMNERIIFPLIKLLGDPLMSVQVAALGVISNIVINSVPRKSIFIHGGGINQLVQMSKSMETDIRQNAVSAIRNILFLATKKSKEEIFSKLSPSLLASLISDPEPSVQVSALCLVCNLVDGCISCIEYVFVEDRMLLAAIERQLKASSLVDVRLQGMQVLNNIASGNEFHKDVVTSILIPSVETQYQPFLLEFLKSSDSRLRTSAVWVVINLTIPSCPGAFGRLAKLKTSGIISQIGNMANDPCVDVKLRVKTCLYQSLIFGDSST